MTYREYESWLHDLVAASSDAARCQFACDTIRCLEDEAMIHVDEELSDSDQSTLAEILAEFEKRDANAVKERLRLLDQSMCKDDVRAIEFDPRITELLCAIGNWLDYRLMGNSARIEALAINMVNAIDYRIGGDFGEYSIDNMEGDEFMAEEFNRQRRLLSRQ